ncbi:MAG: UvrD-helicase domain-containing protein, partial [Anaerotignum sp.]
MANKWTEQQIQAIEARGSDLLIAAAAGSGKTAVLVERIITRILEEGQEIDRLLVVTFTKAAASEMSQRIGAAIAKKLETDPNNLHLQN